MESQIKGNNIAVKNAQEGISLLQTADGALSNVNSILQRMNELCVQSSNDTFTNEDREAANLEFKELSKQIASILNDTSFNEKSLFSSKNGVDNKFNLQVGANAGQTVELNLGSMDLDSLGLKDLDISTKEGASKALDVIKDAIKFVSSKRSYIGASENRLEYTINNLEKYNENLSNAKSRISDTDMAKEIIKYTKSNVLAQTNTNLLMMHLDNKETSARTLLSSFSN